MSQKDSAPALQICFIIGPPGAGKGTVCKRLTKEHVVYHLSVGDYLRTFIEQGLSVEIGDVDLKEYLRQRWLLPADVIVRLLVHKVSLVRKEGFGIILIDGFPRDETSAALFEEEVAHPFSVILFDCPEEVAKSRFVDRARGDDDEIIFDKRYAEFTTKNPIILRRYDAIAETVNTEAPLEDTYQKVLGMLSKRFDISPNFCA